LILHAAFAGSAFLAFRLSAAAAAAAAAGKAPSGVTFVGTGHWLL
jgi:hypothetical protein